MYCLCQKEGKKYPNDCYAMGFYLESVCILLQFLVNLGNRNRWQRLLYAAGALEECIKVQISQGQRVITL